MTPEEFVHFCAQEKTSQLTTYFSGDPTHVSQLITSLGLSSDQVSTLRSLLDSALTDAYYTLLLALDGAASLGGAQELYTLRSADGTELSGHLEGPAWERFHGPAHAGKV